MNCSQWVRDVLNPLRPVVFLNVGNDEQQQADEADIILKITQMLLKQGLTQLQIKIITAYNKYKYQIVSLFEKVIKRQVISIWII